MMSHANSTFGPAERARFPARLLRPLLRWQSAVRTRRLLLELDDRMLRDIGLTRSDVLSAGPIIGSARPARRRLTPLATMVLTILVVVGSFTATMIAGNRQSAQPWVFASCALLEPHCIAGTMRPAVRFGH